MALQSLGALIDSSLGAVQKEFKLIRLSAWLLMVAAINSCNRVLSVDAYRVVRPLTGLDFGLALFI